MNPDLIVVARRLDGLGARLCAILNGWSIAGVLGLEFRFVWPRGADVHLHEPRELFSDTFLDRFEIAASDCVDRVVKPAPTGFSLADAKEFCRTANAAAMIDIEACFEVLKFADESADAAQARYRAGLREFGWSRASQAIIDSVSGISRLRGYSAIHVRAGDIVTGDWRQFLPVEKYTPTPYVEFAIENLSGTNRSPVVVVSDNDAYVRFLKSCFDMVLTPGDIVAGYTDLTEIQRAFADILVLSQARRIVAPRSSAFSRTAVNLSGRPALGVDDMMVEDDAQRRLRDGIAQAGTECSHDCRPLLARDICWYLDVFSDSLAAGDQLALARRAASLDPDFCGALNRSAAALALAGNYDESKEAFSRAQRLAGIATRHADPMVESLATSISAGVLALVAGQRGRARLLRRFARPVRQAHEWRHRPRRDSRRQQAQNGDVRKAGTVYDSPLRRSVESPLSDGIIGLADCGGRSLTRDCESRRSRRSAMSRRSFRPGGHPASASSANSEASLKLCAMLRS